jgi:hypothetical protein
MTSNNPNVLKSVPFEDIENVWTYFYFSYNHKAKKATAFIKYDGKDSTKVDFDVTHSVPTYLRLIIGGSDLGIYPGVNGQFTRPIFKIG